MSVCLCVSLTLGYFSVIDVGFELMTLWSPFVEGFYLMTVMSKQYPSNGTNFRGHYLGS